VGESGSNKDISQFLQTNVQVKLLFLKLLSLFVYHLHEMLDEVQVVTWSDVVVSPLTTFESVRQELGGAKERGKLERTERERKERERRGRRGIGRRGRGRR
jgi:hypothetical protein